MEADNMDIYLEQLRQECMRIQRARLEQMRIAAGQCAKIRELLSELEEVYVTIQCQRAELTGGRGRFAGGSDH